MKYRLVNENPYDGKSLLKSDSKGIVIESGWSEKFISIIEANNVDSIFLNEAFGWKCKDYSFLKSIPTSVIELSIIDDKSKGISNIIHQKKLENLMLELPISECIDFSGMTSLSECFLNWSDKCESIFDLKQISSLYLSEFKVKSSTNLFRLVNLIELTIGNSNVVDLNFLKGMDKLERLNLLNCRKVVSHSLIGNLKKLKWLQIDGYRDIGSIEFLKNLKNLEVLLLTVGRITDIKCISKLNNLKALGLFSETYIENGDLSSLTELRKLSMLFFNNKKNYTHKSIRPWNWEDFGKSNDLLKKII
jgi:hypothetical protein